MAEIVYYFAEQFKTFSSLSVAMLTLSFLIVSLVVPYLKTMMSKVVLDKMRLEKNKKKLPVEKIVENYNTQEHEIGNIEGVLIYMFINIALFTLILFFNVFALVNGTYVKISTEIDTLVWAIASNTEIMGLSVQQIHTGSLIGTFLGFLVLAGITLYIYRVLKKTIRESLESIKK